MLSWPKLCRIHLHGSIFCITVHSIQYLLLNKREQEFTLFGICLIFIWVQAGAAAFLCCIRGEVNLITVIKACGAEAVAAVQMTRFWPIFYCPHFLLAHKITCSLIPFELLWEESVVACTAGRSVLLESPPSPSVVRFVGFNESDLFGILDPDLLRSYHALAKTGRNSKSCFQPSSSQCWLNDSACQHVSLVSIIQLVVGFSWRILQEW